jgi:hypothetical protein
VGGKYNTIFGDCRHHLAFVLHVYRSIQRLILSKTRSAYGLMRSEDTAIYRICF